jgi:hypothetical protein
MIQMSERSVAALYSSKMMWPGGNPSGPVPSEQPPRDERNRRTLAVVLDSRRVVERIDPKVRGEVTMIRL